MFDMSSKCVLSHFRHCRFVPRSGAAPDTTTAELEFQISRYNSLGLPGAENTLLLTDGFG